MCFWAYDQNHVSKVNLEKKLYFNLSHGVDLSSLFYGGNSQAPQDLWDDAQLELWTRYYHESVLKLNWCYVNLVERNDM